MNWANTRLVLGLLTVVVATACTSVPEPPPPEEPVVEVASEATPEPVPLPARRPRPDEYPVANFEDDALYQLLVAEVAVYRGQLETALDSYVSVAVASRDPGVAARATSLAAYMRNDAALTTSQIWAAEDPDSISAHQSAADQLMKAGDLARAMDHMEEVKRLGGLANFGLFAYRAANLESGERESLLAAINRMLVKYPDDEQLIFSKAVLLEQTGETEQALQLADQLLVDKKNINVIILKVNALKSLERPEDAVTFLEQTLGELPENRRLRLIYARFLFETDDLDGSKEQYGLVLEKSPNDGEVLYALALIGMEQKNYEEAKVHFNAMVRWNRRAGEAHFYLGSIADQNGDVATALQEYRQAGMGYEFLPAHRRVVSILADQGRMQEARGHLARMRAEAPPRRQQLIVVEAQLLSDRGLESEVFEFLDSQLGKEPENVELLYLRAMTGEKFKRMDILERDLRAIISIDPENADAMNALGYTLTDQTDRHEEALVLIEKALALRPEEAAFIDSLGWVKYRLRDFEEAVRHLRKALDLFTSDEVAAHLGEVLWVMGQQLEANKVWGEALELKPDSEILKRVIDKFTSP